MKPQPHDDPRDEPIVALPPVNIEAEQSVLGCMMIDASAIEIAVEQLTAGDFYREAHQALFEAITAIHEREVEVDLVTLQEELNTRKSLQKIGGIGYLTALMSVVPGSAAIEHYCTIVAEKSGQRSIEQAAQEIQGIIHNPVVEPYSDMADRCLTLMEAAVNRRRVTREPSWCDALIDTTNALEERQRSGQAPGFRGQFTHLTKLTGGYRKGGISTVLAVTKCGKTSFGYQELLAVARHHGVPCGYLSGEMSRDEFIQRLICTDHLIETDRMREGLMNQRDWDLWNEGVANLYGLNLHINGGENDGAGCDMTLATVKGTIRRWARECGVKFVVVDYFQLMSDPAKRYGTEAAEYAYISKQIKQLASKLGIAIMMLAQVNQKVIERRENKRPLPSDCADSMQLMNDSSLTLNLYREKMFCQGSVDDNDQEPQECEIGVLNNRFGPSRKIVFCDYIPAYARWTKVDGSRGNDMFSGVTGF